MVMEAQLGLEIILGSLYILDPHCKILKAGAFRGLECFPSEEWASNV
jgi:hypothetical protein